MNVERHITVLERMAASGTIMMCQACGASTPVVGSIGICHSCESIVSMGRDALEKRSADLVAALDSINAQLSAGRYDDALAQYDALYAKQGDPSLLYAEGLAWNAYSNREVSLISYYREGFMEENTTHRDAAAKYAARARLLFNKSISACNAAMAGGSSPAAMYTAFLSHVKLGNLRAAESVLGKISGMGNSYLDAYAKMVFDSAAGRFKELAADSEKLMKPDMWSINAFYYMSLALLKAHNAGAALKLIGSLKKHIGGSSIDALEKEAANYRAATLI